jgi:hypothetical protein
VDQGAFGGTVQVGPALVDVLAEVGVRVGDLAVDGEVDEVLALVVTQGAVDEAELARRLFHALGEVTLVEREPQLAVLENVVRARLVIASPGGVHEGLLGGPLDPPANGHRPAASRS